jgi:hypothetical protein
MMGTHPNVILAVALKPDGLSRKTLRGMIEAGDVADNDGDTEASIDGKTFYVTIMEDDYDEDYQIAADEGDIVIWDMVTYGYGEVIAWDDLASMKLAVAAWAKDVGERHHCKPRCFVTANYW